MRATAKVLLRNECGSKSTHRYSAHTHGARAGLTHVWGAAAGEGGADEQGDHSEDVAATSSP